MSNEVSVCRRSDCWFPQSQPKFGELTFFGPYITELWWMWILGQKKSWAGGVISHPPHISCQPRPRLCSVSTWLVLWPLCRAGTELCFPSTEQHKHANNPSCRAQKKPGVIYRGQENHTHISNKSAHHPDSTLNTVKHVIKHGKSWHPSHPAGPFISK